MTETILIVLACGAGSYMWRGLGVLLAGRVRTDSRLFEWVGCVAYAMIAGLVVRIILLPSGTLAHAAIEDRLLACVFALAVYFATRKNMLFGVGAGFVAMMLITALRG